MNKDLLYIKLVTLNNLLGVLKLLAGSFSMFSESTAKNQSHHKVLGVRIQEIEE